MYRIYDWLLCRTIGLAILLLFGFLAPMTLLAQETISFTSGPLAGSYGGGFNAVLSYDFTSIVGDIVLAQALNPNERNQVVTPVSFNFGGLLNSSLNYVVPDPAGIPNAFSFSTHNGKIIGYSFFVSGDTAEDGASLTASNRSGTSYVMDQITASCPFVPQLCSAYTASSTYPGVVVDPPGMKTKVTAPELDYKTGSSALVLLLGGVAILSSRRRV